MIAAHQTMLAPPALPYDAEVDWVEASDGPYINTGVDSPDISRISFSFTVVTRPTATEYTLGHLGYYGSTAAQGRIMLAVQDSSNNNLLYLDAAGNSRYTRSASGSWTLTRDTTVAVGGTISASQRVLIFRAAQSNATLRPSATHGGVYRLAYCKIWDAQDNLVRDFQPVRVGSVGYLYDRANPTGGPLGNGLYGSAGSGSFTVGPDKT